MFLGVVSDSQWTAFCAAFDFPALGNDPQLARNNQRVAARDSLLPLVRQRIGAMDKARVMALCEAAGLPFSPIQRPQDLFDDPHLNASGGMARLTLADGEAVKVPMLPFEMDGQRFGPRLDVPALGSHSRELLEQLGYDAAAMARLEAAGTVKSA